MEAHAVMDYTNKVSSMDKCIPPEALDRIQILEWPYCGLDSSQQR